MANMSLPSMRTMLTTADQAEELATAGPLAVVVTPLSLLIADVAELDTASDLKQIIMQLIF